MREETISNPKGPTTATKPIVSPKKRGRQGSNVINAFTAVPTTPVLINAFRANHDVSVAVLRQAKRFDKTGLSGTVRVKKDKATGHLMIWRDIPASE